MGEVRGGGVLVGWETTYLCLGIWFDEEGSDGLHLGDWIVAESMPWRDVCRSVCRVDEVVLLVLWREICWRFDVADWG